MKRRLYMLCPTCEETWETMGLREFGYWWPDEQDCPCCHEAGEVTGSA